MAGFDARARRAACPRRASCWSRWTASACAPGAAATGWEFFVNFDANDKSSVKGTADFFNDTQRWMNEKDLGADRGHWNQDLRREDGFGFTQEERDAMYVKLPQPLVTEYQYKVREAINPNKLCGGYYRTLTPGKSGA